MNNYQLYRTNVLLSGQMKWDIIVSDDVNRLYVSDFHLSPISNNTPFTYKSDEYLINNSHQFNVKKYYKDNKGNFYRSNLNSNFNNNWPSIYNTEDEYEISNIAYSSYSNIYDMGCKPSKHYKQHGKRLEFLCPVWLEKLDSDLSFNITIKTEQGAIIASKTLVLNDINNLNFHNKFVEYFNAYIMNSGINVGNDDILNISFDKNTATISGLNVSNGLFEVLNVNNLVDNLRLIERPVLDTNGILINSLVNNTVICKQLFNFNICFNIEDVISDVLLNLMHGQPMYISIDVYVGESKLEKMDFYTEYENIDKQITLNVSNPDDEKINEELQKYSTNVLDYLQDYNYVDFINKNKFDQSICHWALCDNNEYIFNVYNGFSGLVVSEVSNKGDVKYNIYENGHRYGNAPDTTISKDIKDKNSTGWLNVKYVNEWNEFSQYINYTDKNKTDGVLIDGRKFINGIKYKKVPFDSSPIYLLGLLTNSEVLLKIAPNQVYRYTCIQISIDTYLVQKNDLVIIATSNSDNLTFKKFYTILDEYISKNENSDEILKDLHEMMTSKIDLSIVRFMNSLSYSIATSPSIESSEITYYKDKFTNSKNYVFRYDGKIKPRFVDSTNTLYYKDFIKEDILKSSNNVYSNYSNSRLEPLYPSIGFCAIKSLTIDRNSISLPKNIDNNLFEYSWFNNNLYLILKNELTFTCINEHNNWKTVEVLIKEFIGNFYKTDDPKLIEYIFNKYEHKIDWDYVSNENVNDYIYTIKLTMK